MKDFNAPLCMAGSIRGIWKDIRNFKIEFIREDPGWSARDLQGEGEYKSAGTAFQITRKG